MRWANLFIDKLCLSLEITLDQKKVKAHLRPTI